VHAWDPLTRLEETLRFLDDAVRAGKINYVGLSKETQLLDEASEPPAPDYPYGVPGQSQRSRRIQGGRF
jgi:aryl-alcohol dehydrogenase-like predicted oxidoreductase